MIYLWTAIIPGFQNLIHPFLSIFLCKNLPDRGEKRGAFAARFWSILHSILQFVGRIFFNFYFSIPSRWNGMLFIFKKNQRFTMAYTVKAQTKEQFEEAYLTLEVQYHAGR